MLLLVVVAVAFTVGLLVGHFTFKIRTRWCWRCGTTTSRFVPGVEAGRDTNRGRYHG